MQHQSKTSALVDTIFTQTVQAKNPFKFELGTKVFAYDATNRQIIQGEIEARFLEESDPTGMSVKYPRTEKYKVWTTSHPQFSKGWIMADHVESTAEALVHLFLHRDQETIQSQPQ